jgi:outer membrane protein assembly factor BamA
MIEKARGLVAREYAKKGYMAVKLSESATFDDTNQRVAYRFNVSEGPQFHMGDLAIVGLSDEDSRRVKELWQLAPGSVFDQSYLDGFVTKAARDFLDKHPVYSGVPLKIGVETKPDPKRLTVDLIITFK